MSHWILSIQVDEAHTMIYTEYIFKHKHSEKTIKKLVGEEIQRSGLLIDYIARAIYLKDLPKNLKKYYIQYEKEYEEKIEINEDFENGLEYYIVTEMFRNLDVIEIFDLATATFRGRNTEECYLADFTKLHSHDRIYLE